MTRRRQLARATALFATATVGLLVAHELDYRFVVPDAGHRDDLLLRTGHGYLSHALLIGLAAVLLAVFTAVALGFARARDGAARDSFRTVVARLAMVQSGGFILLEATERMVAGMSPGDRLLAITFVGIGVQIVAAFAGAFVLRILERMGEVVARVLVAWTPPAETAVSSRRTTGVSIAPRHLFVVADPVRGPPALVVR